MKTTNLMDQFFGEGASDRMAANEAAAKREAAHYASKPYTPAGVLKSWMMSKGSTGNLSVELSELDGIEGDGWDGMDPPYTITVSWDEDRRHVYRLSHTHAMQEGGIGSWIYVPNCPDVAPAPEVHIFND